MRSILKLFQLFSILVALSFGQKPGTDFSDDNYFMVSSDYSDDSPDSIPAPRVTSNYKTPDINDKLLQYKPRKYDQLPRYQSFMRGKPTLSNPASKPIRYLPNPFATQIGYQKNMDEPSTYKPIEFEAESGKLTQKQNFGNKKNPRYNRLPLTDIKVYSYGNDAGPNPYNYIPLYSKPKPYKYGNYLKPAPSVYLPFQYSVAKYPNYNLPNPYGIKVGQYYHNYNYDKTPKTLEDNDYNANDTDNVVGADVMEDKDIRFGDDDGPNLYDYGLHMPMEYNSIGNQIERDETKIEHQKPRYGRSISIKHKKPKCPRGKVWSKKNQKCMKKKFG